MAKEKEILEQRIYDLLLSTCTKTECLLTNKEIVNLVQARSIASVDRALARLKKKNLIETKTKRTIKIL